MWTQRLVLLVVLLAAEVCWADDIEDESPASPYFSSICDMVFCKCVDHETNNTYVRGSSNVTIDIYCTCKNSNFLVINLLSPTPLPENARLVHVSDCQQVTVTPVTNVIPIPPEYLVIRDVAKLHVSPGGALWGENILIKDVGIVEEIPFGTLASASFKDRPINSFSMNNVTIDLIKQGAFANIYLKERFELNNVKVKHVEEDAFDIKILGAHGEFKIVDSWLKNVSASGLGVSARTVNIQRVVFTTLEPHAIHATAEHFTMANSSVIGTAKSFAFDVYAGEVKFVHNTLCNLQSRAFFAVRRADWVMSGLFAFANNRILHAHPGSLNPNWTLGRQDIVRENIFEDCSCASLSWLWHSKYGANVMPVIRIFYEALIDINSESYCNELDECTPLTLNQVVEMYDPLNEICDKNSSYAELCHNFYISHSQATSHIPHVILYVILCTISLVFSN